MDYLSKTLTLRKYVLGFAFVVLCSSLPQIATAAGPLEEMSVERWAKLREIGRAHV